MILLADSGSTKTDWLLLKEGKEYLRLQTRGFNPYFIDTSLVYDTLIKEFTGKFDLSLIKEVNFYGSGCRFESKQAVINNALKQLFLKAETTVESDLLGAARALHGRGRGIAGILGTGSNACLYDGTNVVETNFSVGYIFGDEGSGATLGRIFLSLYLKNKVPSEIAETFEKMYTYTKEEILTHVYKKPNPNSFLAKFTRFLKQQIKHPFIEDIVVNSFDDYFREQVSNFTGYKEIPFSCVGSVAHNFQEQLEKAANRHGITLGRTLILPMEGLVEFHLNNLIVE